MKDHLLTLVRKIHYNNNNTYYNNNNNPDQKTNKNMLVIKSILPDYRMKIKECEKLNTPLDLTRELKKKQQKQWNLKVTVIPIVISALRTVPKGWRKTIEKMQIRGTIETIQITELL